MLDMLSQRAILDLLEQINLKGISSGTSEMHIFTECKNSMSI